ncbi:MAG: nitroreductase family protein [Defluviitaleaceae bacterium]|nr:nitroreductase family protein [Defluviitaleaceae bacterium]MCL2200066.1 nitroreductase family protein [Defluviitaleaceae bacterium]
MDIYEAINTRRTIRDFDDKQIDMAIIEKIIDAGLKAPSHDHMVSWEFVVVGKDKRAEVLKIIPDDYTREFARKSIDSWGLEDNQQREMYLDAIPKQHAMLYNAGCLILPFFLCDGEVLNPDMLSSLFSLNDLAAMWCCIENILLAAASEGIFGVTKIPANGEEEHIKNVIGHPKDYIMPCYIALGYPAKNALIPKKKEISVKERIHMDTWKEK